MLACVRAAQDQWNLRCAWEGGQAAAWAQAAFAVTVWQDAATVLLVTAVLVAPAAYAAGRWMERRRWV